MPEPYPPDANLEEPVRLAFLRAVRTLTETIEAHPQWPHLAHDPCALGTIRAARECVADDAPLPDLIDALWHLTNVVERLATFRAN